MVSRRRGKAEVVLALAVMITAVILWFVVLYCGARIMVG